jgi:hypothetical protein
LFLLLPPASLSPIPAFCITVANPKLSVLLPLALASLAVLIAIPTAAAKSRLHIPGYVGLAFLCFALALLVGWLSGTRHITGTIPGLCLSILFFLLIASTTGSVLALFFYRHPEV